RGAILAGLVFSLGLVLVVIGRAELFTGNNLIVMAWASGKVRTRDLLYNWAVVFAGNFVCAFATAILVFYSTQYTFGGGAVELSALTTAHAKTSLAFVPALTLGVLCNALVCLGVWMCYGARSSADRMFCRSPLLWRLASSTASPTSISFPSAFFLKRETPTRFGLESGKNPPVFRNLTGGTFFSAKCCRAPAAK